MARKSARISLTKQADLSCGSHRAWVYHPQRLIRSHEDFQIGFVPQTNLPLLHECRPGRAKRQQDGQGDAAPHPGHSLFQESFFVCRIKGFGDVQRVKNIYVETVIDADCGRAFAKVYPSEHAMNGVDILQDRVLPFYKRSRVAIGRVLTSSKRKYCGMAPIHPFETLLASSHIDHKILGPSCGMRSWPCEDFHRVLSKEFFIPAIRKNSYNSFGKLQQDLDAFVENYNHGRPNIDPYVVQVAQDLSRSRESGGMIG